MCRIVRSCSLAFPCFNVSGQVHSYMPCVNPLNVTQFAKIQNSSANQTSQYKGIINICIKMSFIRKLSVLIGALT